MDHVVTTAKALLRHDLYYDEESDEDSDDESDDGKKVYPDSDMESDISDDTTSDNSEDDKGDKSSHKCEAKTTKKTLTKREHKQTTREDEPKSPELKPDQQKPDPDPMFKSSMDDLANRISKLMVEHLTKHQDKPSLNPQATTSATWHCYMCDGDRHGFRDCPETKAFLAAGVLRYDASNCLVMADRSKLPCIAGRALVNAIHDQIARKTLAASLEWMPEFEVASHEVTAFGNAELSTAKTLSKVRPSKAKPHSSLPSTQLLPPIVIADMTPPESKAYVVPQR